MLNLDATAEIRRIREFLEDVGFAYASQRLVPANESLVFPSFRVLQEALKKASRFHRMLLSVLRQGHAASEGVLRSSLPRSVFDALLDVGLLVRDRWDDLRTPDAAIVPFEGLFLVVSLPPYYPTTGDRKQPVYLGPESLWLTRAYPPRLHDRVVLDVCAGSGVQALVCAARGARRVVALEKSPVAVNSARFNCLLNGLADVVDVRESDLFSALLPGERFDFVVANPPFMPVVDGIDYPLCGAGGPDGLSVLGPLVHGLPAWMADTSEGAVFCNAIGDQHTVFINNDLDGTARDSGLCVHAYVTDKQTLTEYAEGTLRPNLRGACPELDRDAREKAIAEWLTEAREMGAEYVYGQVLRLKRPAERSGVVNVPMYNAIATDPLVSLVGLKRKII
jgi:methylase of polypeptide subunit release factors